jgi:hypothetical protein
VNRLEWAEDALITNIMATCSRCGVETQLYDHDVLVCIACLDISDAQLKPKRDVTRIPDEIHLGLPHD